jgi:hypothetical protein
MGPTSTLSLGRCLGGLELQPQVVNLNLAGVFGVTPPHLGGDGHQVMVRAVRAVPLFIQPLLPRQVLPVCDGPNPPHQSMEGLPLAVGEAEPPSVDGEEFFSGTSSSGPVSSPGNLLAVGSTPSAWPLVLDA